MRSAIATCLLLAAVAFGLSAGAAAAQDAACPAADPTYTGNCGPTFALPAWGDAGGWTDPSQYSTIQLADIDGDGRDELLGRSDAGIQIHEFDTTVGQWRPQVTANGTAAILSDFRSPLPSQPPGWNAPEYYTTIQTADVDGQPGEEVLGRVYDGMRVYKYTPGAEGAPGNWAMIGRNGPFSDADGWGSDPSLYSTIQTADVVGGPGEELLSRTAKGIVAYRWNGSTWSALPTLAFYGNNSQGGNLPRYYANIIAGQPVAGSAALMVRDPTGVHGARLVGEKWGLLDPGAQFDAFGDDYNPEAFDCPFTSTTQDCLGSSPSYYETLQMADVDGNGVDELLGRAIDGLRVKTWGGPASGWTENPLPTLTALAGPATTSPGIYGSIQTANLDGKGGREVLALDGTGLQGWSYDAQSKAWTKLSPSTPLALGAEPWLTDPSTYSTIQAGDVDGDGRDEVIARGPYGIRTWFYDRRGTGGWERYLPEGYPSFATTGQQNAFAELNSRAKSTGVIPATATTIRDVWSTENAPQPTDLTTLQRQLTQLADCSQPNPGNPPSVPSCTPPAGTGGFTAADWTAVVNELLAESYWAFEVVNHFTEVNGMRQSLFIAEGAELPAIGSALQLQAAANAQASYDLEDQFAGVFEIIGAIAGLIPDVGPLLSSEFAITGDIMSMLPSASNTLTSTFNTTYSGVQAQFANGISEVDKALPAQSQLVRQDLGLMQLVGQLRSRGTWKLDSIGAGSAGSQGFALWAYKTLLGTVYARYQITDCTYTQEQGVDVDCSGPGAGLGVIGGYDNFTAFGPPPAGGWTTGTPCHYSGFHNEWFCTYRTVTGGLSSLIWGSVSPQCAYRPGNANSAWTFGCSVGVSTGESATWNAPSYTGGPVVNPADPSSGGVGGVGSGRATLRLAAPSIVLPRSVDLRRARVSVDRVLHEPRGIGELVQSGKGRRLTPIALRRVGKGRRGAVRLSGRGPGGSRPTLQLRKRGRARLALTLRMPRAWIPVAPAACNALPASLQHAPRPVQLHTRVRIDDGRRKAITMTLRPEWRCRRDRTGTVTRLSVVRPKPLKLQSGLALRLRGPGTVAPGATARFSIRVRNGRKPRRDRLRSSFWNASARATPGPGAKLAARPQRSSVRHGNVLWRYRELRGGSTRTLHVRVRAPRSGRKRVCVHVVVGADRARPDGARRCARVAGGMSRSSKAGA